MKLMIIFLISLSFNVVASNKIIHSNINFVATGKPSFIKANGKLNINDVNIDFQENILNGDFIVDLTQLDSGIELRDKHLKEKYLEVEKFPKAVLTFQKQKLDLGKNSQKVPAILKLHGESQEIEVVLVSELVGDKLKLIAEFELILTDYNIELPSFQGITAAKNVKIKVESEIGL